MLWKYAMILVHVDSSDSNDVREICKLVEVYNYEEKDFMSYCNTDLLSPAELKRAAIDVESDGVNSWFCNNGFFSQDNSGEWIWERVCPLDRALLESGDIEAYEDEIELYTVYGGA